MGITTEEALKMEIDSLKEQLKATTDQLEKANQEVTKVRENEAERLRADILDRSSFKAEDLGKLTLEELYLVKTGLDRAGVSSRHAGIKKSVDARKATNGLSVGRYDSATKTWVGA